MTKGLRLRQSARLLIHTNYEIDNHLGAPEILAETEPKQWCSLVELSNTQSRRQCNGAPPGSPPERQAQSSKLRAASWLRWFTNELITFKLIKWSIDILVAKLWHLKNMQVHLALTYNLESTQRIRASTLGLVDRFTKRLWESISFWAPHHHIHKLCVQKTQWLGLNAKPPTQDSGTYS